MTDSHSSLLLLDGSTGQEIEAILCETISSKHLNDFEMLWRPWREEYIKRHPEAPPQQSDHWDWKGKMADVSGILAFPSFAIECKGETQGLMVLNTLESCRLACQSGKSLVYIEYLEAAPWNLKMLTTPRFKGVGGLLFQVAIQVSIKEQFEGRVGLHSLPQSDEWYRSKCGMNDLGVDEDKQGLHYFEMTAERAGFRLRNGE